MPNHVRNRLMFEGEPKQVAALLAAIQNEKYGVGSIDFQKIIPMPPHIYRGNLGREERLLYGEHNWYDWSVKHWGTKWNAYDFSEVPYKTGNPIYFSTAWSAPHPVVQKLSAIFPEVEIHHAWAEEQLGLSCGRRTYLGGEIIAITPPESQEEALALACEVWKVSPDELVAQRMNCDNSEEETWRASASGGSPLEEVMPDNSVEIS
ncbi:MAG: hypothetical protein K5695_14915 [Oscillospiraceae bacterium]|nr:hypothetical protein [Oscillospiraceae bacterium]